MVLIMKKVIAFLCAAILVLSLCGCRETEEEYSTVSWVEGGGNSTTSQDGDAAGNDSDSDNYANTGNKKIDNPLNVDLKGATILIYDTGAIFKPDSSFSKTEKARAELLNKLQKELNCKFKVVVATSEKIKAYVTNSAASGKALCGIIAPNMYESGYYIAANLVTNLTRVSSMDLSKNYMNRYGVLNASQFGKAKYAVAAEGESRPQMVYFNKRILKELGFSESYIYDLVNNGKWTYDVYRDLAKKAMKDLDGKPGMSSEDQWGQVIQDDSTAVMSNILISYGAPMLSLSSSGKLQNNMTNPNIMQAINLSKSIFVTDGTKYNCSTVDDKLKFFEQGKALFCYASIGKAMYIADMKDEFGVAPAPQVAKTKNYISANDYNCRVLMIPAGLSAKDQYNAGAVIQAYQYLYKNVLDAMEKEYTNRYLRDVESAKNWRLAADIMTTMPQQLYAQTNEAILSGTYRVFWDYYSDKEASPASKIESTKSSLNKALEELNKNIKDK
jgi:ABC-type glycerol-3-phosphate transport system substrate-binding protein